MTKTIMLSMTAVAVLFLAGCGKQQSNIQGPTSEREDKIQERQSQSVTKQPQGQNQASKSKDYVAPKKADYIEHTDPVYRNDMYGFEITMPKNWNRYAVWIDTTNEGFPNPDSDTITFALPVDVNSDWPNGYYDYWYLTATPVNKWQKDMCSQTDTVDGPCYQGEEIGRNGGYVFEEGNISGAIGNYCSGGQFKKNNARFCSLLLNTPAFAKNDFRILP